MHREAMENSWLRKAESESQEIPCFCHNFALITDCSARWKFCFFSCHSSLLLMHICIIIIDFIGRCLKSSIGKLSRQGFFFCCSSSIFYGNVCRHLVVHLVLKYVCRVVQFWLLLKRVACITNCKISFPKVMDALLFTFHRKLFLFS